MQHLGPMILTYKPPPKPSSLLVPQTLVTLGPQQEVLADFQDLWQHGISSKPVHALRRKLALRGTRRDLNLIPQNNPYVDRMVPV